MSNAQKLHTRGWLYSRLASALAVGIAFVALPALGAYGREPAPVPPPAVKGVVVLFSGSSKEVAANWHMHGSNQDATWKVKDGAMTASGTDIVSKQKFTDFHLHVEFKVPYMPEAHGQGRGNSGVFCQGRYEIQVLDSYGIASPGSGDCGAVYGKAAPLVNACRPPLKWQAYDIIFRAPRFDSEGKKTEDARVTVLQNGIVVQNNTEIPGPTWGEDFGPLSDPGPIVLQFHGNTVQYRDVWVVPLPLEGAQHY